MKRFHFSLEKMLSYQDSLLEEEKNRLAELRIKKNQIDRRMEENESQIALINEERAKKCAVGMSILEMQSYNYGIDTATRMVKDLTILQAQAQVQIDRQLERVLLQQQEVSGLERLREKQLEEHQIAEQKEQELLISEMVSAKYIRNQAETG